MRPSRARTCLGLALVGLALLAPAMTNAAGNQTLGRAIKESASPATTPHIVVLATGGTIASGSERALSGEQLVEQLHLDGRVQVEVKDVASGGSSNLSPTQIASLPRVEIVTAAFDGDDLLLEAGAKGGAGAIVVAAFGSGTIPAPMRRFVTANAPTVPLIMSARVQAGLVKQAYGGGSDDETRSATRSGRLDPAKARVLAMVALAAGVPINQTLLDAF